jgi:hypothetical protein
MGYSQCFNALGLFCLLPLRDIDKHPVGIGELVLPVAAGGDESEAALGLVWDADDSLAHLGVGFAQRGQFFFDGLHAFDFVANVL